MIEGYSDKQLQEFDKIVDDIILGIFNTKFKRDWILGRVKRAFDFGYNEKDSPNTGNKKEVQNGN